MNRDWVSKTPDGILTFIQSHLPIIAEADIFTTAHRHSKWGDFRSFRNGQRPIITVNGNLNPWAFTLTLLHEIAHLQVHIEYGHTVRPHGKEWKRTLRKYLVDLLDAQLLPPVLEPVVSKHLINPKATLAGDPELRKVLGAFDNRTILYLDDLSAGQMFRVRGRTFKKGAKRRTRHVCTDLSSDRKYLVHGLTEVELL